jgi:hypothetical protein
VKRHSDQDDHACIVPTDQGLERHKALHSRTRRTHEDLAHIRDRVAVYGCPTHDAAHYLAAFVSAHDLGDGIVRIPMRACAMCSDQRVPTKLCIAASMYSLHSTSDRQLTYSAMWFPETSDPSLMFAGALAVEAMPHDDRFSLLLSGHHVPRGTVDGGPTTSHGRSRTHVAPHDVLRTIATHIERAHAHDQAAHAGHPFAYASQELGTAAGESLNERTLPEGFHSSGRSRIVRLALV